MAVAYQLELVRYHGTTR